MQPLAKLLITDMWVSYATSSGGGMFVQLALPNVSVHDLRPSAATANSLVFSTTDAATAAPITAAAGITAPEVSGLLRPLLVLLAAPTNARAHRVDESLAATRLASRTQEALRRLTSATGPTTSPSLLFLEYRYLKRPALPAPNAKPAAGKQPPPPAAAAAAKKPPAAAAQGSGSSATAAAAGALASSLPSPGGTMSVVALRLQKPTLVLDLAFLMPLLAFVAPSAALNGAVPAPWASREVLLGAEPHVAKVRAWR